MVAAGHLQREEADRCTTFEQFGRDVLVNIHPILLCCYYP